MLHLLNYASDNSAVLLCDLCNTAVPEVHANQHYLGCTDTYDEGSPIDPYLLISYELFDN